MNNTIYPCIWFEKNDHQAEFYCKVFPNTRLVEDNGLVQMLSINGQSLMFLNAGPIFKPNASVSFLIANENEQETESLFNELANEGIVLMPLGRYPFSVKYGWVRDKYGVTWQLFTGQKGDTDQYFTPTLMFLNKQNGNAKKAISFYTNLFPDSKVEGVLEYDGNEDLKGNVQHAQFSINGFTLACMDSSIPHPFNFNEGISMVVLTKDQEETNYYWNNMINDGGKQSRCGWLKDKFGLSWQIVPAALIAYLNHPDKEKAKKAGEALMKMDKIIIADIEKAIV